MKTIKGDLLDIREGIIIHQVNCQKIVGGLAGALTLKFPRAFDIYFNDGRPAEACFGTYLIGATTQPAAECKLFVCHLFGQLYPGENTDLRAVEAALKTFYWARVHAQKPLLYAPYKIGCGIGGGDWDAYSNLLEEYLPGLTIVQKYEH